MNLNYTIYYPLTEKYISIYPKSNGKSDTLESDSESQKQETNTTKAKPPMWPIVEKCMEDNTLDLLREGKLNINANGEKIQAASSAATTTSKDKSKKKDQHAETKAATQKDKHTSKVDKSSSKKEGSARHERGSKKHEAPQQVRAEDQDDSDGGFFE